MSEQPLLYSRKLAALALSISLRSIGYLIEQGLLKTTRVGSRTLIHRGELERFARRGYTGPVIPV